MFTVKRNIITLTRGDTLRCILTITDASGEPYELADDDVVRFAMKHSYDCHEPVIIEKIIDHGTLLLQLDSAETKSLPYGVYVYDIQLTTASGMVDTFISGTLELTKEVA